MFDTFQIINRYYQGYSLKVKQNIFFVHNRKEIAPGENESDSEMLLCLKVFYEQNYILM